MKNFWQKPIAGFDVWDIDSTQYEFHDDVAERVIEWWETELTLSKTGDPFLLQDWQKQVIGHLFGWKQTTVDEKRGKKLRRFRRLWLYIPRKNGKTELGAGIALIGLIADDEQGPEVYNAAKDSKQAARVYEAAKAMIDRNSRFREAVEIKPTYKSMYYPDNGGSYRVLSADSQAAHGTNPHVYIIDEVHVHPNRTMIEAMESGVGERAQPLGVYMTTADYQRESVCNEYHEAARYIRDNNTDPTWMPIIYEADEKHDDWEDEAVWEKVNPNLGVSKRREYMRDLYRQAKSMKGQEVSFKRLQLNIQTKVKNIWLVPDDWKQCATQGNLSDYKGEPCYVAVDMGATRDLTARGIFFPKSMLYECQFWAPAETIDSKLEYQQWERQGYLKRTPGRTIDSGYMRVDINELSQSYKIMDIAYDPWNATELARALGDDDELPITEFRQGYRSMNEPSKRLETLVTDHKIRHLDNPIMNWMVENAEIIGDPAGSIKPVKPDKDSPKKIDGIVTLVMCIGLWINNEGELKDEPQTPLVITI